jgi:CPA2 family monovalent cation:H+ antiporter-2
MISIFLICFAIALLSFELGMSLAFGAFLAGLMISESEYSHNIFGNFYTIKDVFSSFFFVSIGMLFDVHFVIDNWLLVMVCFLLVITMKSFIAGGTGFVLGHTLKGTILIGLALSQVGEFSFILASIGFDNGILPGFYYQLFLAVAVLSMGMTPFLFYFSPMLVEVISKLPLPVAVRDGLFPLKELTLPPFNNHLVIIGKDPSAQKLSLMARYNNIRHISIIFDPTLAHEKMNEGDTVVYGDAVNEPVLRKAYAENADVVVISVGNLVPSLAIVEKVRKINNNAYILVRSATVTNIEQLYKVGADEVIPEKLEIAIDMMNRILTKRHVPNKEINRIISGIRNRSLGAFSEKDLVNKPSIFDEFHNMNISVINIGPNSSAEGMTLIGLDLRRRTGVTILAIKRGPEIIEHPAPDTVLHGSDIAYVIGEPDQVKQADALLNVSRHSA